MQKKRFFSYLVLTLTIGVFAFAFAIGQTVRASDAPAMSAPNQVEGGDCWDVTNDGDPTIYDQITGYGAPPNGAPAQDFEAAFEIYTNEAADDFVVDGMGWIVTGLDICGTVTVGPVGDVDIWIYADDAGGPAATATCSYTAVTATATSGGNMELDFADCALNPGTYWAAIQVNQDFGVAGQYFWSNVTTAVGGTSQWRNPGDGFGTGCTDWDATTTCGVGGGNPSFLFAVEGTPAQPTDVNLTSFDGGSNNSVIAAIIVGIFSLGVAALVTIRYRLSQDQVA
jgi:hypothetical protein